MLLGLGDHTEAILSFTRAVGVLIATGFMFRMLLATYRGNIHPIGGLGISTLVLVVFFLASRAGARIRRSPKPCHCGSGLALGRRLP